MTKWEGDPGNRTATVVARNVAGAACLVDSLSAPWLIDGSHVPMLIGTNEPSAWVRIGPGDELQTLVSVRNYCGGEPRQPVTVAFLQGTDLLIAQPLSGGDTSGVPTCAGQPNSANDIVMRAWAP